MKEIIEIIEIIIGYLSGLGIGVLFIYSIKKLIDAINKRKKEKND